MPSAWAPLVAALLAANPFLEEGKQLYRDMLYPQAADKLRVAVDAPNVTPEERREAVDLLARSLAAQGRVGDAEREYARLLEKEPNTPAPLNAAPKIRQAFLRAKERLYPRNFAQLTLLTVSPASIELNMLDPWQSVREVAVFQAAPQEAFVPIQISVDGAGRVTGRLDTTRQPVRYYATATDSEGRILARIGSQETPLSYGKAPEVRVELGLDAPPPEPAPRWPRWLLGATAVLAAGAGAALAVSSSSDSTTAGSSQYAWERKSFDVSARNKAIGAYGAGGLAVAAGGGLALVVWKWR